MQEFIRSKILKKFILAAAVFLVIMIAVNVIVHFQFKKIQALISERNSLINLNGSALAEALETKDVGNRIRQIEKKIGLKLEDISKILSAKIQKPDLNQILKILQAAGKKSFSLVMLEQDRPDRIRGEWRGSLDGFKEALGALKTANFSLRFDKIEIRPELNNQEQSAISSQKKFIIKFTISII
jgi:DNA-binding phage protein